MTKVIVFDFDGTLTLDHNCWFLIWKKLNLLDYDNLIYTKFKRGELTSAEWMNKILEAYKQHKLNVAEIEDIAKNLKLINNINQLFSVLKDKGIKIYILSSGVKNIISIALKKALKYVNSLEAIQFKFNANNELEDFEYPNHDIDNKQEFVNRLICENEIAPSELFYVGNDWNDEVVARTGCKTLCLNADETDCTNTSIWHNHIETDNILDILPFLDLENNLKF